MTISVRQCYNVLQKNGPSQICMFSTGVTDVLFPSPDSLVQITAIIPGQWLSNKC